MDYTNIHIFCENIQVILFQPVTINEDQWMLPFTHGLVKDFNLENQNFHASRALCQKQDWERLHLPSHSGIEKVHA